MRKLSSVLIACLALVATVAAHVRLPQAARAVSAIAFSQSRPAAKQLPAGFVLPSSDVDLRISSLVAADLDADGDLDIVAAGNGPLGIVVWVNDGFGRLTRKRPERSRTFGFQPPAPSVDRQRTIVVASIQPESPAEQVGRARGWLVLPEQRCALPRAPDAASTTLATLRSRSPPFLS